MTLSFPRSMPTSGLDSMSLQIQRVDALAPEVSGRSGGATLAAPLWRLRATIANGDSDDSDEFIAFIDSLRGQQRLFFGFDASRPLPRMYRNGFAGLERAEGGDFDGTTTEWSLSEDRDVLELADLPEGLDLRLRDYVGFAWETGGEPRRSLHRYIESAQADSSGVHVAAIEPPVPPLVPAEAKATLLTPTCLMRQVTAETEIGETDVLHTAGGRFSAIQVLLE